MNKIDLDPALSHYITGFEYTGDKDFTAATGSAADGHKWRIENAATTLNTLCQRMVRKCKTNLCNLVTFEIRANRTVQGYIACV